MEFCTSFIFLRKIKQNNHLLLFSFCSSQAVVVYGQEMMFTESTVTLKHKQSNNYQCQNNKN